ncbi:MAG: hypothetical protein ABF289_02645 [Clostridiales bacterium]
MILENIKKVEDDLIKIIKKNKNYVIGISGIDCSGKSTISKKIYNFLLKNDINAYCLSGDDFLFDRETRYANKNQIEGYYNECFNYKKLFNEIILPAKKSNQFSRKIDYLNWQENRMETKNFVFKMPMVIILEGVFLFKKIYLKNFDYTIWLDISFKEALKLALQRPRDIDYYGDKNVIMKRYTERFYPAQLYHILNDNPDERCNANIKISIDY